MIYYIYRLILALIDAIELLVIVRAIGSWFPAAGTWGRIYSVIRTVTEPLLMPIRKLLSKISFFASMPIDFSPIALFIVLGIVRGIVTSIFRTAV